MISIRRTDSDNPDFQKLTSELDVELCQMYNTKASDYEEYNRITDLRTVVLAYVDSQLAGCGCFRKFDVDSVELKRMYVLPAFRGKGIASMLVQELEKWAIELGNKSAVLETGNKQLAAISMYRKLGYFNADNHLGVDAVHSICMKKDL